MADFGFATLAVSGGGSGGQVLQLPAGVEYSQWGAVAYMAPEVRQPARKIARLLPTAAWPLAFPAISGKGKPAGQETQALSSLRDPAPARPERPY